METLNWSPTLVVSELERTHAHAWLTAAIEGFFSSPAGGWVTSAPQKMTGSLNIRGLRLRYKNVDGVWKTMRQAVHDKRYDGRYYGLTAAIDGFVLSPAGGCVMSAPIKITGAPNTRGLEVFIRNKNQFYFSIPAQWKKKTWSPSVFNNVYCNVIIFVSDSKSSVWKKLSYISLQIEINILYAL